VSLAEAEVIAFTVVADECVCDLESSGHLE